MAKKNYEKLNTTLIHQLKKKIEELNEEKERYTELFEQSNDAIILITLKGKIFGINNKTEELIGYREKDIVGKQVFNLFPKEKLKETKKCFINILKEGICFNENRIITKNRNIKDIEVNAKIIKLKEGTFIQAIFRDLTEKKRAEERLRESEEKYRILLENLPQKIFLKDINSTYISCNKNYAKDLKIKPEQIKGKTDYEFYPKKLAEKYRADDKKVMKEGKIKEIEEKYIQNGNEVFVHTVKIPVRNEKGSVTSILGIFWDITRQKKAEEDLKEREEKFRAIFENAGEGILIADANTKKFAFANSTICRILGYKEKELLKLRVDDIHPKKDLHHVMEQFKKQLEKKILTSNLPVLRKDKKVIFCNITATPLMIKGKTYLAGFFLKT